MNFHAPRLSHRLVGALAASSILTACAGMAMSPAKVADGALTDTAGKTLYTFDRDVAASGKSVCNGPCAGNWPAFAAPADATTSGDYTVVTRDDGAKQWAFRGKPLYTFAKDTKAGDRIGDGFNNNVWHIARP